jgi:hypothetical protein
MIQAIRPVSRASTLVCATCFSIDAGSKTLGAAVLLTGLPVFQGPCLFADLDTTLFALLLVSRRGRRPCFFSFTSITSASGPNFRP